MKCVHLPIYLSVLCLLCSCKKVSNRSKDQQEKESDPPPISSFVPVEISSDHLTIKFKYRDQTAELVEVNGSDGVGTSITYKNEEPYEIRKSKNGVPFELVDYVRDKNNLPKARIFSENGPVFTPLGFYILGYDTANKLSMIKYFNDGGKPTREITLSYDQRDISEKINKNFSGQETRVKYAYDAKNGIFSAVPFAERIFIELAYDFVDAGLHNRTASTNPSDPLQNISFEYQYNDNGYPISLLFIKDRIIQKFFITYMEVKPAMDSASAQP